MPDIVLVQPTLPTYRLDFFGRLARALDRPMRVYFSPLDLGVLSEGEIDRDWAQVLGPIRSVLSGFRWQHGAISVPLKRQDIVVISGNPRYLSSLLLLLRARLRGARTIWWGHYWSSTSRSWGLALRLLLMRGSHALLFYTDAEIAEYRTRGGGNGRPIGALNNGINLDPIKAVRAPYRAAERNLDVLFIGRITEKARLELALDAIAGIAGADVTLHVIGGGNDVAALQERARKLGVEEQVQWHGGTSDEGKIAEVANRCRLFLYPGEVGLSLIHGMAYGLPALVHSNRRKHMPEIAAFSDGETGKAFCEGDADDLAAKLGELIADDAALDRLSAASLREVETEFTTERMVERFVALVRELEEGAR